MKRNLCLFLLSPFLLAGVACGGHGSKKPVDVVIISGQSNAVGCTWSWHLSETMGIEKKTDYEEGFDENKVQIAYACWTKNWELNPATFDLQNQSYGAFVKVRLGQGNGSETFGPEIGISEELQDKLERKLFLIKFACGAANLKDDFMTRTSPMYPRMIEYIENRISDLKKKGYEPTIKAFCWMQGEGDTYAGYYDVYQQSTRTFVSNLREDLNKYAGGKNLPFIDAGICESSPSWPSPGNVRVNEAKQAFAAESPDNYYLDTVAAGLHTDQEGQLFDADTAHYDSESQIDLGHMFAQAFEPFLGPDNK